MSTLITIEEQLSLAIQAQQELGLTQQELANLIGSSLRTIQRWSSKKASPYDSELQKLAVAVYPRDPKLAERLAVAGSATLESLGVVAAADPRAASAASLPPALIGLVAESVVSAAAEALDVSPRVARPALLAALERAKLAGLGVDHLLAALRPSDPAAGPSGRKKPSR
jgi:transcriptional regulator with XRE-family HTH domain